MSDQEMKHEQMKACLLSVEARLQHATERSLEVLQPAVYLREVCEELITQVRNCLTDVGDDAEEP